MVHRIGNLIPIAWDVSRRSPPARILVVVRVRLSETSTHPFSGASVVIKFLFQSIPLSLQPDGSGTPYTKDRGNLIAHLAARGMVTWFHFLVSDDKWFSGVSRATHSSGFANRSLIGRLTAKAFAPSVLNSRLRKPGLSLLTIPPNTRRFHPLIRSGGPSAGFPIRERSSIASLNPSTRPQ